MYKQNVPDSLTERDGKRSEIDRKYGINAD